MRKQYANYELCAKYDFKDNLVGCLRIASGGTPAEGEEEPQKAFTNIQNGYGIVSGYQRTIAIL